MADRYVHGKEHEVWIAEAASGLSSDDNKYDGYVSDTSFDETRSQSKVTVAADESHTYGPPGQVDGKISLSGPWTPTLDRLVSKAIRKKDPLYFRYRPSGTGTGRLQIDGTMVVTGQSDSAPDGIMTISVDAMVHDDSYSRSIQT